MLVGRIHPVTGDYQELDRGKWWVERPPEFREGWKPVLKPQIDGKTQRYGPRIEHETAWVYPVEAIPDGELLTAAKVTKLGLFYYHIQSLLYGGFSSSALGDVYTYNTTTEAQLDLAAAALDGQDIYFRCTAPDGTKEAFFHTAAQIRQVFDEGKAWKIGLLARWEELNDAVTALEVTTTLEDAMATLNTMEW